MVRRCQPAMMDEVHPPDRARPGGTRQLPADEAPEVPGHAAARAPAASGPPVRSRLGAQAAGWTCRGGGGWLPG